MSKCGQEIDWSKIASASPKRLRLEDDDGDGAFHFPVQTCENDSFTNQRSCRKHVKNKHPWFYYFDEKPGDCQNIGSTDDNEEKANYLSTYLSCYHPATSSLTTTSRVRSRRIKSTVLWLQGYTIKSEGLA